MTPALFDTCRSYLIANTESAAPITVATRPAITFSRETGAGAVTIAELVAKRLQEQDHSVWAVFDRNLVEKIVEEHQLPREVGKFIEEDKTPTLKDALEEILGLHPASWTLREKTESTIKSFAQRGNVILVGRGAHIITAGYPNVTHVRLIAPLKNRIENTAKYYGLEPEEAEEFIHETDRARHDYVKQHYGVNVSDLLQYDLIINTARITYEEAAELIAHAATRRQEAVAA